MERALGNATSRPLSAMALRPKLPHNLTLYEQTDDHHIDQAYSEHQGFIPSRPSLKTRLEHWIAGYQH